MNSDNKTGAAPLFTVIIPTRNRGEFLRHTLRTCAMQDYERLDVVVADDASSDDTREVAEEAARLDPRIRYAPAGERLGMRENFERALAQARPGFVMALGGDDGLLPGGIRGMHEALRETGAQLLTWPTPIFRYPGAPGAHGQLGVYLRRGLRLIESRTFLRRQAKTLHYLSDVECPMFYVKGVASTTLVDAVRRRSPGGRFYASPTPDGYSGIVLAGEVSQYAFSGRPFSMHGLSANSQGQAYLSNDEQAKILSREFVSTVASTPMHRELASQPVLAADHADDRRLPAHRTGSARMAWGVSPAGFQAGAAQGASRTGQRAVRGRAHRERVEDSQAHRGSARTGRVLPRAGAAHAEAKSAATLRRDRHEQGRCPA